MGYRYDDKPVKPEDMLPRFTVRNGATERIVFDCFYMNWHHGHRPDFHDHVGWPRPDNPDHSCQIPRGTGINRHHSVHHCHFDPLDFSQPIDFTGEEYTNFEVAFEDADVAENLDWTIWLEEYPENHEHVQNAIRLVITANLDTFHDKPVETRFTIFAMGTDQWDHPIKDEVLHAMLVILPGNPGTSIQEDSPGTSVQEGD